MLQAAIPVEAVTTTASDRPLYLSLRADMIFRSKTDLPVPIIDQSIIHMSVMYLTKF
jgi:hypothetical protein